MIIYLLVTLVVVPDGSVHRYEEVYEHTRAGLEQCWQDAAGAREHESVQGAWCEPGIGYAG